MDDNRCVCCGEIIPEGGQYCPICGKGGNDKPKTNLDRIRRMTVKELAEFLNEVTACCMGHRECEKCPLNAGEICYDETIAKWLESEANND